MVAGKYKSRKYRKIYKKTPGGRIAIHYLQRKAGLPKCSKCGSIIRGRTRIAASHEGFLPKSDKRVGRIFGGYLCNKCTKEVFKKKARET